MINKWWYLRSLNCVWVYHSSVCTGGCLPRPGESWWRGGSPRHHRIPPKETVKEEDTPPAAARELAPEPEGSQAPPTEGQEVARGAYPPPGSLSWDDNFWYGTVGVGAPPVAPGPHVWVVGAGPLPLAAPLSYSTRTALGLPSDLRT